MKQLIYLTIFLVAFTSCNNASKTKTEEPTKTRAKFEPEDGKCILFAGQELEAIGGLEEYNDGYFDHFDIPAGFTMYTKIRPGDESFGFRITGLPGVVTTDDWGDGPSNMSMQLADDDFKNCALAIGLEFFNHEKAIARGEQDSLIIWMAEWLKSLGRRPVFLRIGYEFSGEWNGYDREAYIASYRRIKDMCDSLGVNNVAYVWQSHGFDEPMELLESWYPGDEYVDWCSYSFFARWAESNMIEFARKKGKPVFIAEATPVISTDSVKTTGKTKQTILSNSKQADEAWNEWFVPFFKTIHDNADVVKAISYINCHWKANRMWFDNPHFQEADSRLQTSEMISKRWKEETNKDFYLKASDDLFDILWNE